MGGSTMSRSLRVRQPRTADIRRLHEIFESALEPGQRRRAQAILLYAAGLSAVEIARLLEVHARMIYADLHAFDIYGVTAVYLRLSRFIWKYPQNLANPVLR